MFHRTRWLNSHMILVKSRECSSRLDPLFKYSSIRIPCMPVTRASFITFHDN